MTTPQFGMSHKFVLTMGATSLGLWTKVSGLSVKWKLAEYRIGTADTYYKVGGIPEFPQLKLQRALDKTSVNNTKTWLTEVQTTGGKPIEGSLKMLNSAGAMVFTWALKEAFPAGWSISEFDATSSKVLVETLEIVYGGFFQTALKYS